VDVTTLKKNGLKYSVTFYTVHMLYRPLRYIRLSSSGFHTLPL